MYVSIKRIMHSTKIKVVLLLFLFFLIKPNVDRYDHTIKLVIQSYRKNA